MYAQDLNHSRLLNTELLNLNRGLSVKQVNVVYGYAALRQNNNNSNNVCIVFISFTVSVLLLLFSSISRNVHFYSYFCNT